MKTKQVLVIRKDLNMRKGKMIAQGAHASMKVFFDRMEKIKLMSQNREAIYSMVIPQEMQEWIDGSFTKICVSVNSEQELLDIYNKAHTLELPCALIQDAGHTEFKGVPTYTCCAIGPEESTKVDEITSHLPLL